jgi:putative FmdB family regulatory protein
MPIYEYRCQSCQRRFSHFTRGFSQATTPQCPHCHSTAARRLMSRFAVVRGEESHMEDLADPAAMGGFDENDPVSIARYARKMGREVGEEIDRLESGQSPEEVEQELGMTDAGNLGGQDQDQDFGR